MNILTRLVLLPSLTAWLKAQRQPSEVPTPLRRPPLPGLLSDDPPPSACGWFDSSHELHAGLLVVEHADTDRATEALQLQAALEVLLAPQGAQQDFSPRAAARRGWRPSRRKGLAPRGQQADTASNPQAALLPTPSWPFSASAVLDAAGPQGG